MAEQTRRFVFCFDESHIFAFFLGGAIFGTIIFYASAAALKSKITPDCAPEQASILRFDGAIERVCFPLGINPRDLIPSEVQRQKELDEKSKKLLHKKRGEK